MRPDSIGIFWQDKDTKRIPKPPPPKRKPPERTWENSNYLPRLEEARNAKLNLYTMEELRQAARDREVLVMDIECYSNYFLVAFTGINSGKVIYFERMEESQEHDWANVGWDTNLRWIVDNFLIVTFNGNTYDLPILTFALEGHPCEVLKQISDAIIKYDERPYQILKAWGLKQIKVDHIDLIEVCPLSASLKIYGGRLHTPLMWELPFKPDMELTEDHITILRWYCINDLVNTAFVYTNLTEQLQLRTQMSAMYGIDLRSKSDAQIAEAVIRSELTRINGLKPIRPEIPAGTVYHYKVPDFLNFKTPVMQEALSTIRACPFVLGESGAIERPKEIANLKLTIGGTVYQMGIGGLHSCEKRLSLIADSNYKLFDRDVSSYYPAIILNQELYPEHLGRNFLTVYRNIVNRRLAAKKSGNKLEAEVLKIVINGSFGKFGSPYSILYAPQLIIQTTITGQLSLLLLIERLESSGIHVVSANTDGMLIRCPTNRVADYKRTVEQWEKDINFKTEEAEYLGYHAKDVNNYIGIKEGGETKNKGAYNNPWNSPDPGQAIFRFHKNPVTTICIEAAIAYIVNGTPLRQTVEACTDITKFIAVRAVKGGAVKAGEYLGKSIRWYYAKGITGEIVYAANGYKVPKSEGAKPLMDLPVDLPSDIDYSWYSKEAFNILVDIGFKSAPPPPPKTPQSKANTLAN